MEEEKFIRSWIKFACQRNNVDFLSDRIKVKFSSKLSSCFANANSDGEINFSSKLWSSATTKQKKKLVIHETCHIISWKTYGLDISPHGKEWKSSVKKCGIKPTIKHNVKKLKPKTKESICDCSKRRVTKRVYEAIKNGFMMNCIYCESIFRVEDGSKELDFHHYE